MMRASRILFDEETCFQQLYHAFSEYIFPSFMVDSFYDTSLSHHGPFQSLKECASPLTCAFFSLIQTLLPRMKAQLLPALGTVTSYLRSSKALLGSAKCITLLLRAITGEGFASRQALLGFLLDLFKVGGVLPSEDTAITFEYERALHEMPGTSL